MLLVAGAAIRGSAFDRGTLMWAGGGLLAIAAIAHLTRYTPEAARVPAGQAGLALASFIAATGHGAGLMLVPALMPLCGGGGPGASVSGGSPLLAAIGAALVHMAAMLAVTGVVASGVGRLGRRISACTGKGA